MEEKMKVTLHGLWVSPYTKCVEMALKLKNIPFDYVEEDFANKSALLLKTVHKKVPVLIHNGNTPICESLVILEYIDETWKHGPKLLPEDPYERAQVRFWSKFLQEQVLDTLIVMLKTDGEVQEKAMKEMEEKLRVLEKGMKDYFKPDVNEKNAGVLDILISTVLRTYKWIEDLLGMKLIDTDKFPVVFSWFRAINELQLTKELSPPHEKVIQFLQVFRQSALRSAAPAS